MSELGLEDKVTTRMSRVYPFLAPFAVFFFYVSFCFALGLKNKVNLISGVDQAYEVHINNRPYLLKPYEERMIHVPDGEVRVSIKGSDRTETFEIKTALLSRPFKDPIFVVNPDRAAVIVHEQVFYIFPDQDDGSHPNPGKRHYMGQLFYSFEDANIVFGDIPSTISVSTFVDEEYHVLNRLAQVRTESVQEVCEILRNHNESPELFLRQQLAFDPHNDGALQALIRYLPFDMARSILEKDLDKKPVNLAWHRAYQDLMVTHDPKLFMSYQKRLQKDPDNETLNYLAERLDPEIQWFTSSAGDGLVRAYVRRDEAQHHIAKGEFDAGLERLLPIQEHFRDDHLKRMIERCREATGDYEPLLAQQQAELEKQTNEAYPFRKMLRLKVQAGGPVDIRSIIAPFLNGVSKWSHHNEDAWRAYFRAYRDYLVGDLQSFVDYCGPPGLLPFQQHLARNEFRQALDRAYRWQQPDPFAFLAIHVLAFDQGNVPMAEESWQIAEILLESDPIYSAALLYLQAGLQRQLNELPLNPSELALLFVATAQQRSADEYIERARPLNIHRDFPYLTLRRLLERAP